MIAEVFCISTSQEVMFYKKYLTTVDATPCSIDVFSNKIADRSQTDILPLFTENGRNFYHILRGNLYLIASSSKDMCSIHVLEILMRLYQLCKDFCGVFTEDALHSNLLLIHELLNEFICNGCVQLSHTEKLRQYILTNPITMKTRTPDNLASGLFGVEYKQYSDSNAEKPVVPSRLSQEQRKSEVYIDVIERLTIVVDNKGHVVRNEIQGKINLKCFLLGTPTVQLGLNPDLIIGRNITQGYGRNVQISNTSFHDSVNTEQLDENKILIIHPPQGEFCAMNYSHQGELPGGLPFTLMHNTETCSNKDYEVNLRIKCNIPSKSQAIKVEVMIPVPLCTTSVSHQLSGSGQKFEYLSKEKKVLWEIRKMIGGSETTLNFQLNLSGDKGIPIEIGPVTMDFEISGLVCSDLQIRYLHIRDQGSTFLPFQWVRYITVPDSYTFKIT